MKQFLLQSVHIGKHQKYETIRCSVEGCDEGAKTKGKCIRCYQAEKRADRMEKRKNVI